jgi:hypothetical protein
MCSQLVMTALVIANCYMSLPKDPNEDHVILQVGAHKVAASDGVFLSEEGRNGRLPHPQGACLAGVCPPNTDV